MTKQILFMDSPGDELGAEPPRYASRTQRGAATSGLRSRGWMSLLCALAIAVMLLPVPTLAGGPAAPAAGATPPDFTVAFIADQGSGASAKAVLELIKAEGADMVLHQGDFDYNNNPSAWDALITQVLGTNFPYFASVGNHDSSKWGGASGYQKLLTDRLARIPGASCSGDYGVNSACSYQGLDFILSGVDEIGSGHDTFIRQSLSQSDALWRICSWHKNMNKMQAGGKGDETGWGVYEACREGGAIVATGHEHSYSRTFLMSSFQNQTIADQSSTLRIELGKSFAFVSGLGGKSIRDQQQNWPWMAAVYTSTQGADYGALFCTFHVNGRPDQANCYFKDLKGKVPDQFQLVSGLGGNPTPTTPPPTTPTPTTPPPTTPPPTTPPPTTPPPTTPPPTTPPSGDFTPPTLDSFSVSPATTNASVAISAHVSDAGGSHLKQIQVWRAADLNGTPDPFSWHELRRLRKSVSGATDHDELSGQDNPPDGTWHYRLHAVDGDGNWAFWPAPIKITKSASGGDPNFQPFGAVTVASAFEIDGQGTNIDSIALWEAPNPADTLMFVTAKGNNIVEVWKFPFKGSEQSPLRPGHTANGVLVDQRSDKLYVGGGGKVTVYSLPSLQPLGDLYPTQIGAGETNLGILYHNNGQTWILVSEDKKVQMFDAAGGQNRGSIIPPVVSIETVLGDSNRQVIYIPEEQGASGNEGVYAYNPDASAFNQNGSNRFGNGPFVSDEEGIALYTCPSDGLSDNGAGFMIVTDQSDPLTKFEFFNRQTWQHLGTLKVNGVGHTDGVASSQRPLPGFPSGVFAAVDNDAATAVVGWDIILSATGLTCGGSILPPSGSFRDVPANHWAFPFVEALFRAGYIKGCQETPVRLYCPEDPLTRAQEAVFVLRGVFGASHTPPQPPSPPFNDVPLSHWAVEWVDELKREHYTAGCTADGANYCPDSLHTIAEGAVFFSRMLNGPSFTPPSPSRNPFIDLPANAWYTKWLVYAFNAGLLGPCRTSPAGAEICPNDPLPRDLAAYIMTNAKALPIVP